PDCRAESKAAHEALKPTFGTASAQTHDGRIPDGAAGDAITAVTAEKLRELNEQLLRTPDWFTPHPKLMKQLERRRETIEQGGIDWGQAEALGFASLLGEGIPIRITGQDTERGTFSQRHAVL